jgi:hypothetical protein
MRRTVMITAPNGARVRTAASKTFYTVRYGSTDRTNNGVNLDTGMIAYTFHDPPKPYAYVERRSDNVDACRAAARHERGPASVYRLRYVDGKPVAAELYRYRGGALVAGPDMLQAVRVP